MEPKIFLFWAIAILTLLCAVMVVVTQNIVRAAAWLLFALAGTAGIFFLLGADFIGSTQILVYVGGTLVLVVFGVMLTAQGPFITMKTGPAEWLISTAVGLLLFGVIAFAVLQSGLDNQFPGPPLAEDLTYRPTNQLRNSEWVGEALLGITEATPPAKITGMPPGQQAPERQRLGYLLPFEIVSVHLLVVLVGAAYLARAKRRRGAAA